MTPKAIRLLLLTLMATALLASAPVNAHSDATPTADPCVAVLAGTPVAEITPESGGGHTHGEADFDLMFIDMMIPHHQGAVVMGEAALHHAQRPEIIELSESIIATQTEEIEQMLAWRDEWYPDAPAMPMAEMEAGMDEATGGHGGHHGDGMAGMDMQGDMATLCAAADFDRTFLELMIPHHESAVAMAEALKLNAVHDEMKAFADEIIAAQQAEIDQMREWLAAWYPPATPEA